MAYENLILSDSGPVRVITINRPKVHNALNGHVLLELEEVLLKIEQNKDLRALVITGAGDKSFVAGADIAEMKNFSPIEALNFSKLGQKVFDLINNLPLLVVAAVNGYALGGGLELALACDFIYAQESASFGLPETKLGLIPGFGGCARLSNRVGMAMAKEMIFSGEQISAPDALRIGLINRLTPNNEVVDVARHFCQKIAKRGQFTISLAKNVLNKLDNEESLAFGLAFSSMDHHEGINAFLKRA